ncbi:MAG: RHS repeat-associated core domain-containing protein, partial [Candidatus Schekmanbacteria bacterium]|nr:RHS repeat-associated core domain-containing protein [Candidatus Schekmanbacteria bacterium]
AARTPGGRERVVTIDRQATLADSGDPLSVTELRQTATIGGRTWQAVYDAAGRRWTLTSPLGRTATVILDGEGRVVESSRAGVLPASFTWDTQGRLTGVSQGTRTTTVAYDPRWNVASVTDPLGRVTAFAYDLVGRTLGVTAPGGGAIGLAWDAGANVTAVTPPDREAHAFTYTPVDLPASYDPPAPDATAGPGPNSWSTTARYDLDRRAETVTDAEARAVDLRYNAGGRLARLELPEGREIAFTHDGDTGRLAGIAGPDGTALAVTWDGVLPLAATWSGTVAGSVAVTWNDDFRVTSRRVNGGSETAYTYDDDGLLTGAGSLALARDAATGFLSSTALGGVTDTYAYDSYGDLASYSASAGGDAIYAVSYQRDDLGRITARQETMQGETADVAYAYDEAGRLAAVTEDGAPAASWTYDANGNRTSETTPGGTIAASYDGQDRLVSSGDMTYAFGAAGQLAGKTGPEGMTDYVYDVLGNLRSVSLPDGTAITYEVDGVGRRVGKKINGVLQRAWLYQDALEPVAELDGSGALVSVFVYASRPHVPDAMVRDGTTYRILSDHLGSVRLVVDAASGAVAQRLDYDAWGRVLADTNPGFQPFGFAGGLYDPETGQVRFGARDYDAAVGRWTARDPKLFDSGDVNLFAYVGQDPVNNLDTIGFSGYALDPTEMGFGGGGPDSLGMPGVGLGLLGFFGVYILTQDADDIGDALEGIGDVCPATEHTKGARPSTKHKHQEGKPGHKGPWPPKQSEIPESPDYYDEH